MTEERWQLVPVELTQAMLDATCGTEEDDAAMRATWAELLRVAPSPTPAADEVEAVARAIYGEQDFHGLGEDVKARMFAVSRAAIAAMQARSAEPAGEEPVAWDKLEEIGITSWRQACEWMIELDEIHVGDGETEILEGFSAIRKALLSAPATPTNPERLAADPLGVEEIDLDLMRKREVQAMGAALSNRNWHDMETAYNQLRDKVDRELGRRLRIAKASAAPLKEGSHDVLR